MNERYLLEGLGIGGSSKEGLFFNGVLVYDGCCGAGKTYKAKELVNLYLENENMLNAQGIPLIEKGNKFIFVSPYNDECHRIAGTKPRDKETKDFRPKLNLYGNEIYNDEDGLPILAKFKIPSHPNKPVLALTKSLIKAGQNIATTHAAMCHWDKELLDLIEDQGYHLIIDEIPPVFETMPDFTMRAGIRNTTSLSEQEINFFEEKGLLTFDSDGVYSWDNSHELNDATRYNNIKKLCQEDKLLKYGARGKPIMLWRQNPRLFSCFKSIRILTYKFEGSIAKAYFDLYNIQYSIRDITVESVVEYLRGYSQRGVHPYHKLVEIHTSRGLNQLKLPNSALSSNWFKKHRGNPEVSYVRKALDSFFKNKCKNTPVNEKMWTCYKVNYDLLVAPGYSHKDCFVQAMARATNDYDEKSAVAYCVNMYLRPVIKNFFNSKDIEVEEESFALGEMLQWIFRSRLRKGQPILLFIPSSRMETLFKRWLKEIEHLYAQALILIKEDIVKAEKELQLRGLADYSSTQLQDLIPKGITPKIKLDDQNINSVDENESQENSAGFDKDHMPFQGLKNSSNNSSEQDDINKRAERGTDLNSLLGK